MTDPDDRDRPWEAGPVRVLTVDDHDYFRGVMREVVQATDGFELVGEADSGEAALLAVEELAPSLVIMDKRMPGMGGIEACRLLADRHPEIVLVITSVEQSSPTTFAGRKAVFIRKQKLSPRLLRKVWDENRVPV